MKIAATSTRQRLDTTNARGMTITAATNHISRVMSDVPEESDEAKEPYGQKFKFYK